MISGEAKAPITRAAVALHNAADSALIAGDIASADGVFRVRGLRPGAYYLRVTSMGFKPQRQTFTITADVPLVDVGTVALAQSATQLQGVEVTADRPAMTAGTE